jgi:hypothetical protein
MPQESLAYFIGNVFNRGQAQSGEVKVKPRSAVPLHIPYDQLAIGCFVVFSVVLFFLVPPIAQPQSYHQFADKRPFFGIPYFFNVISNLGFLWAGQYGLKYLAANSSSHLSLKRMYGIFFTFVFLGGLGSAYYHLMPNNFTLFFDRLPMIIAIMALFSSIISERTDLRLGYTLMWPLIVLASASVVYWEYTEMKNCGDLRAYGYAQLLPIFWIPYMLLKNPVAEEDDTLWLMIIFVAIARLGEVLDGVFFTLTFHLVSGHTIKHIFLFLAICQVFAHLRKRNRDMKTETTEQHIKRD